MNGFKLNEKATKELVNKVGRSELFDEISFMKGSISKIPYPRYLKAVKVTLVSLGFDEEWVNTDFKNVLDAKYLER